MPYRGTRPFLAERMAALADRLDDAALGAIEPIATTWRRSAEAIREVLDGETA